MLRALAVLGIFVLGLGAGVALTTELSPFGRTRIDVVDGYTTVTNETGTALGLAADRQGQRYQESYNIAASDIRRQGFRVRRRIGR